MTEFLAFLFGAAAALVCVILTIVILDRKGYSRIHLSIEIDRP